MSCYLEKSCKKYHVGECPLKYDNDCIKLTTINTLYDLALITEKQRQPKELYSDEDGTDLEEFRQLKQITLNILTFVNGGYNLYLYSENTGNGKTEWALKILKSYINNIWYKTEITCKALFISVPKLLLGLKENITQKSEYIDHIKKYVNKADIVIWDDIGSKCGTEFEIENMLYLINSRIDDNKANIFTSNIIPNELPEAIGPRLASRVLGTSTQIKFNGIDKRGLYK